MFDVLLLIAVFLLSFFWSPPPPIKIIVWVLLACDAAILVLSFAGYPLRLR